LTQSEAGGVRPTQAAFAFIFVTVLLDSMGIGLIVPVLPKLIKAFEGGDSSPAARIGGYFGAAWALMQFIFQPVLGGLSDRFGRRPVVILSNIGLGLDYILMAVAPNLWFLFAGRLISGITAATFSTASAYIADVTPAEKRAARFGLIGAAFGLGFVIGPAIGGFLGEIGLRFPFWGAAAFSLVNGIYGFFVLPESLPKERRAKFSWKLANPVGSFEFLMSNPALSRLAIAAFLQRLAHGSLPSMFVFYVDYRFGWSATTVGWALTAVGVAQMIVAAGLIRLSIARVGERGTLLLGLLFGISGFAAYAFAENGTVFMLVLPLIALWGLANPAIQSLQTQRVGADQQGRLQGAQSSLGGIADMIGPLVFTQLFAASIAPAAAVHFPGATYFLASILVVGALIACWPVVRAPVPVPAE
jgi:DHA1 family tetracycline resistance protein-like MFS transporter